MLNATFALDLHKRMFHRVWQWAGTQRKSNKNIGVSKEHIVGELAQLFGDMKYLDREQDMQAWDEIGARFHHRLVSIHVFVNGNGRHARLMTDILLNSVGQEVFSWGLKTTDQPIEVQGSLGIELHFRSQEDQYISALKKAGSRRLRGAGDSS